MDYNLYPYIAMPVCGSLTCMYKEPNWIRYYSELVIQHAILKKCMADYMYS